MAPAPDLLLERERELEAICDLVRRARHSDPAVLLAEGPAGIGKTALLEQARRLATDAGMQVLSARGGELETEFPFGVVSQLFEPVIRGLPAAERGEVLAGAAGLAAPVVAGAAPPPAGGDRFAAVSHGLYWLTVNLAERAPPLLAVDDLHWADASSLRFLVFLIRRLAGLPVALMMCMRPGEPSPEQALLAGLLAEPGLEFVRPAGLSERAVAVLIESGLGVAPAEPFVRARVAAVLGPATDGERVARLAGVSPEAALEITDALVRANILTSGPPLRFVHPILRAAVNDDLGAGERAAAHARAAGLLAGDGGDPDAIAAHLLLSAPAGSHAVVEQLRRAASLALGRGAPENAAAYLVRALAEEAGSGWRAGLLSELAAATMLIDPPQAIGQLQEAISLTADPAARVRLTAELTQLLLYLGRWQEGAATVDAALSEPAGLDRESMVLLESLASGYAAFDPRLVERFDRSRPALRAAIADRVVTARAPALLLASITVLRSEDPADVDMLLQFGLDDGRLLADESAFALIPQAFLPLIFVDDLDRVAELVETLAGTVSLLGSIGGYLLAVAHRTFIHARGVNLRAAEADLRASVEGMQELGLLFGLPSVLWYGLDALVERPELADLAELALRLALPPDFAATFSGAMLHEAQGRLRAVNGDAAAAADDLRASWEIVDALGFVNPNVSSLRCELALALAGADPGEARRIADETLADARRVGQPRAIGVTLRTLGILEGGEPGLARLREAVAVLEGSPARLEHARALVELGAALRRANRRTEARGPLADGLELAHRAGATRLEDRARRVLQATGARPRRPTRSGADALTPSELRIAEMAAGGMGNPQIGQALFVTRNTVETHLRHVYQKLGIRRREDLPGALEAGTPPAGEG